MYQFASFTLLSLSTLTFLCSSVVSVARDQHVLQESDPAPSDIIHALERAEIIPTVIDSFHPYLLLSATWSVKEEKNSTSADLGNTLEPTRLQTAPNVSLHEFTSKPPYLLLSSSLQFTIILTDPDAPSRDDPKWSEMCHWIVTNVSISGDPPPSPASSSSIFVDDAEDGDSGFDLEASTTDKYHHHHRQGEANPDTEEIIPYKPPGPPHKTGKHRYVFLAFAPANATHERLNLTKPEERKHWGFEGERVGVRQWAAGNGLVAVAANFIYAQNEKQ